MCFLLQKVDETVKSYEATLQVCLMRISQSIAGASSTGLGLTEKAKRTLRAEFEEILTQYGKPVRNPRPSPSVLMPLEPLKPADPSQLEKLEEKFPVVPCVPGMVCHLPKRWREICETVQLARHCIVVRMIDYVSRTAFFFGHLVARCAPAVAEEAEILSCMVLYAWSLVGTYPGSLEGQGPAPVSRPSVGSDSGA